MRVLCSAFLFYFHQIINVLETGLIAGICARSHTKNTGMYVLVAVLTLNILSSNNILFKEEFVTRIKYSQHKKSINNGSRSVLLHIISSGKSKLSLADSYCSGDENELSRMLI